MNLRIIQRILVPAIVALGIFGCATPLGGGLHAKQELLEVRYVPGTPPRLAVRADFLLENTGNRALDSIDVALPDAENYGRQNLQITVDGRAVASSVLSGGVHRLMLDAPWPQKQKRALSVRYDLAPSPPGGSLLAVNDSSFHLREFGWYPQLRPPPGAFAQAIKRPGRWELAVDVPEDFLVDASGAAHGRRKKGGEVEYRFRIDPKDFEPFVVGGRYYEREFKDANGAVIFWTLGPLPPNAQSTASQLAAAFRTYETSFGLTFRKNAPARIVESPASLGQGPAGNGFPGGALLNRDAFAAGVPGDEFLQLAEHELAHTWFGVLLAARPEAEMVLGEAAANYAAGVADEARAGATPRQERAARWLRAFDEQRKKASDKPLASITAEDPWEQRAFAYSKGPLFFLALEDECGKDNVRHALARMVRALSGGPAGFAEMRSALEGESGKNLAEFFRVWLSEPGIPAEFRRRYEARK